MPYGFRAGNQTGHGPCEALARYLICAVIITRSAGLVALGHIAGIALAGVGCPVMWRMIQYRIRSGMEGGPSVSNGSS